MSAIIFDAPSTGNVNSAAEALAVVNKGTGAGISAKSTGGGYGISAEGAPAGYFQCFSNRACLVADNLGTGLAVSATSLGGEGVLGHGKNGVHGRSESPTDSGVWGENTGVGYGVAGSTNSENTAGVWGDNRGAGQGVRGTSEHGRGVWGYSTNNEGVRGESNSVNWAAVAGIQINKSSTAAGVWAESLGQGAALFASGTGGGPAGHFEGRVEVNGQLNTGSLGVNDLAVIGGGLLVGAGIDVGRDISVQNVSVRGDVVLENADCAEEFEIADAAEADPGTVMVLGDGGVLRTSCRAYDKRVGGVIAGAGSYKSAIILDRRPGINRRAVALVGKTFCKVDADCGAIEVGDLLTTSTTPGHAMKASDATQAFGAVLGKALRPLRQGRGLVPILVALQ